MKRKRKSQWLNKKRRIRKNIVRSGGWSSKKTRNSKPELKAIDIEFSQFYPTPNFLGLPINICQQGTARNQRIGSKIFMKYLLFRFTIYGTQETSTAVIDNQLQYRILVVYDFQTNGVVPNLTDVLSVTGTFKSITSPLNLNNKDRFRILADKIGSIPPLAQNYSPDSTKQFYNSKTITIKKKLNLVTIYDNTSTSPDVSQIKTGGLYLYFITTNTLSLVNVQGLYTRVRFEDP